MPSYAWDVYGHGLPGKKHTTRRRLIDTVFFDKDCDKEYVKDSLINHDGYDPDITIKKGR